MRPDVWSTDIPIREGTEIEHHHWTDHPHGHRLRDLQGCLRGLLVEGETWAETVKLDPEKGMQARALAQAINLAARNVEQVKRNRAEAIRAAKMRLAEVEQDRSAITQAQANRGSIEPPAPAGGFGRLIDA